MIILNIKAEYFSSSMNLFCLFSTHCFERLLEGRDEVRNVFDRAILMVVPVLHFLFDIPLVFLELTDSVFFNLFDSFPLPFQFIIQLLHELALLLKTLFLLCDDGFFNLSALFSQVFEDFTLFLNTSILLSFEIDEIFIHLGIDGSQLVV